MRKALLVLPLVFSLLHLPVWADGQDRIDRRTDQILDDLVSRGASLDPKTGLLTVPMALVPGWLKAHLEAVCDLSRVKDVTMNPLDIAYLRMFLERDLEDQVLPEEYYGFEGNISRLSGVPYRSGMEGSFRTGGRWIFDRRRFGVEGLQSDSSFGNDPRTFLTQTLGLDLASFNHPLVVAKLMIPVQGEDRANGNDIKSVKWFRGEGYGESLLTGIQVDAGTVIQTGRDEYCTVRLRGALSYVHQEESFPSPRSGGPGDYTAACNGKRWEARLEEDFDRFFLSIGGSGTLGLKDSDGTSYYDRFANLYGRIRVVENAVGTFNLSLFGNYYVRKSDFNEDRSLRTFEVVRVGLALTR